MPALAVAVTALLGACEAPAQQTVQTQMKPPTQVMARNPVILADVPDIAMIRVGDTYYMSSTTMHMSPGLPIMKSKDLVNWELVSYAYDTLGENDALTLQNGKNAYGAGSWASSLRFHNGTFYVSTFSSTVGKTHIYTTKNIERGPWKEVSFTPSLHDHSLFFDDDGRVFMVYGGGDIRLVELTSDLSGIKAGGVNQVIIPNASLVAGPNVGLPAEGSQMLKVNGKYFISNITWPRGGMRTQILHRADTLTGPYEGRVVLQDAGVAQGSFIDTPGGDWYAYLFQDHGAVGRVPFMVPVKWQDGWPVLGDNGKLPTTLNIPAGKSGVMGGASGIVASDEFSRRPGERALPLAWQWNHNPDNTKWSLSERPGFLRLTTGRLDTDLTLARNTLTQRTFGPTCSGTVALDVSRMKDGDVAGLSLLQKKYGFVGVKMESQTKSLVMVSAESDAPVEVQSVPLTGNTVWLKAECDFKNRSDKASFFYSLNGKTWTPLGQPLQMVYTLPHFIGYRFGLFNFATKNTGGSVDFDYLRLGDTITAPTIQAANATVTVQAGQPGKKISPDLMGIFFEDINYSADGGLYAELSQNRSFEYSSADRREWNPLTAWELVQRGGGKGQVTVETANALNTNNPHYAVLTVEQGGSGVGLMNSGFDGIALKAGERYNFSCFARRQSGENLPLSVTLESKTGTVLGTATLKPLAKDWLQYSATIQATGSDPDARLVIATKGTGAVALDMVSLFPVKTFRNRPNGLRADLAQVLADIKPRFVRFPGGCVAHGDNLHNTYPWKNTIGPVENRKAMRNLWGYHQTMGLGYLEYFQFCEDIGAKPLPVVAAGVECQFSGGKQECIPMENMGAYIQDVLDLIEWANGPVSSPWGAKRALAGHPQPFNLQYLGVGNEDAVTPEFKERFTMIERAIKAKYPNIVVIGSSGPAPSGTDFEEGWKFSKQLNLKMVDEHYYMPPQWFLDNVKRYDSYDRTQPKVYLGEYASKGNTMFNALSEAAYMTGLERNGDIVQFASYAPLLAKANRTQWNPDLIYFNNTSIVPTTSYYVQQLYGQNAGDTYLPNTVAFTPPKSATKPVSAFVGTWNTQAEFENVRLQSGPKSTLRSTGVQWNLKQSGTWKAENGLLSQSGGEQPALYQIAGAQVSSADGMPGYTLSLRARKTGGQEGFLIGFGATDASNYYWWNVGGWNNTQHGIEKHSNGATSPVGTFAPGRIENNRWYDIKIVVTNQANGQRIQSFLDGKLVHDVVEGGKSSTDVLVASSVRDTKTGDIILKLVNVTPFAMQSQINLAGLQSVKSMATRTVFSGNPADTNTFENPRNIVPQTSEIRVGKSFVYAAPPHSFTVIRMKTR